MNIIDNIYNNIFGNIYKNIGYGDNYDNYSFFCDFVKSQIDQVSKESLDATGLAATRYGYDGGSFGAGEAVVEADGLLTNGAYTQLCKWSEDASKLPTAGVITVTDTNETITINQRTFKKIELSGTSVAWHGIYIIPYRSAASTNLCFNILYSPGTSGEIVIYLVSFVAAVQKTSIIVGSPGSLTISSVTAGEVTILKDSYAEEYGCYQLSGVFAPLNSTETHITLGPNSPTGKSLYIYGTDIFTCNYLLPHVPSSGTAVSVPENYSTTDQGPRFQIRDTGAGEVYMPELLLALYGTDGTDAQATIPYKWRPMFNAGDLGTTLNIVTANEEATTFLYYDDVNGMLKASDGTNTSEVTCSPVSGTEYEIEISYNTDGMQISVDGMYGSIGPFAGRISVGDYMSYGWEADAPQYAKQLKVEHKPKEFQYMVYDGLELVYDDTELVTDI